MQNSYINIVNMGEKMKYFLNIIILFFSINFINSESVKISQIDTSKLLFNQTVSLYLSVTDNKGKPIKNLDKESFEIYESVDGNLYKNIDKISSFKEDANYEQGINFLLLIDNSGSMYNDINDRNTSNDSDMKISYAVNAVKSFLGSIDNVNDKIGIAAYNSYYNILSEPVKDKENIYTHLESIERPGKGEGWTEIYSSLYLAINDFSKIKGRKAIIILSDGMNEPFYKKTGTEHKVFGTKTFTYTEPIDEANKEGISIFAINFANSNKKDNDLTNIAEETGGKVFNAYNQNELEGVYKSIKEQILDEYLLSYKATMSSANKKYVMVTFKNNKQENSAVRYYFSSTLFGDPFNDFNPIIFLAFLAAIILLLLLSLVKFQNKRNTPSLEVLSTESGKAVTKIMDIKDNKTIIGCSDNADMTIVGSKGMKENHATIQFDKKKNAYTLVATGKLTVNNKSVSTKVLESGDLINAGGATIIFDEGMMTKTNTNTKK